MKSYEPTDLDRYITFFSAGLLFFGVTANGAGNIPDRDPYCKKLHWKTIMYSIVELQVRAAKLHACRKTL